MINCKVITQMNKDLGAHIKALREDRNISQNKLATKSGVTRQTIILIEQGKVTNPRISTINKILKPLGYKLNIRIVICNLMPS